MNVLSLSEETKTQKLEKSATRFDYIDALRGIAILGVILTHTGSITQLGGRLRTITDIGGMGVYLFFVISAFTIFHMLSKHSIHESKPLRNFFIRRLFRIVPVYWFGIILYTVIFGFASRGWLPGPELWHYPLHITLTNLLHPQTQSSVVPGGWSISCEVLFYMTVPFWFARIRSLSHSYVFALVCVVILPVMTLILKALTKSLFVGMDPILTYLYWERFPLASLGSFSFGILLFYALKNRSLIDFIRSKVVNFSSMVAVCVFVYCLSLISMRLPLKVHMYSFLFMALALLLSVNPWRFFVNSATVFIGRISYSAYLFHFLVLKALSVCVALYAPPMLANQHLYFVVMVIAGVGLTIPVAWCGYQFIERPAIEISRRWIRNLEKISVESRGGGS